MTDTPDIESIRNYALSNDDIQEILEPDTKIITYPKFGEMSSIDEAFDSLGRCIFLYLTENASTGHWVTMWKTSPESIYYFDSYGKKPDEPRNWLPEEKLEELGQDEPYLTQLLKESGYKVSYNTVPFQKTREGMNDCGRWCVGRLICKDMDDKQFFNLIKQQMKEQDIKSPDDWICLFTYSYIGK